jgi:hypothetical protein
MRLSKGVIRLLFYFIHLCVIMNLFLLINLNRAFKKCIAVWRVGILVLIVQIVLTSCHNSSLPEININVRDEINFNTKIPCSLMIKNINEDSVLDAKIEARGGISRKYEKKSFEVKFKNKTALLGLPLNKSFVLNANYIDKTFMRHKICYALFKEMSSENKAPQCKYVNLSINENYNGLYVLMEGVNADFLELNKQDTLAMLFKDPPVFVKEKIDFVEDKANYYQQKYPKKSKSDKTHYIEKFKSFLFDSDDAIFAENIEKWIDLKNIIDWHLLLYFSNNGDGIVKNFYLYKQNANTPFRISIWDCDHSFGRDCDNELNIKPSDLPFERSILFKRLLNNPYLKYKQKLRKRWWELRNKNIFSLEHLESEIEKNKSQIANEIKANFKLWPVNGQFYFDRNTFNAELKIMLDFIKMNTQVLDRYFKTLD